MENSVKLTSSVQLLQQQQQPIIDCTVLPISQSCYQSKLRCQICERTYETTAALNMHNAKLHALESRKNGSINCKESGCSACIKTTADLRNHLTTTHNLKFKLIDSEFANMKAFLRWKKQVEAANCVCFVKKKTKNLPFERQSYFYCHNSSYCTSASNQGVHCTAQLFVKENFRSDKVTVSGCLTHYGHSMTSRHFLDALSRRIRTKEGGVASQCADLASLSDQLVAIYELAVTKKKQKSVDKICAALRDLYECLKDYDEDDETLPGLEETQAWRRSEALEKAEQEMNRNGNN